MNRKVFIVFLLMAVLVVFGFGSCLSNKGPIDIHNSRNSLDWEGTYAGTVMLPGGPIVDFRISLDRNQHFEMYYKYLDNSYKSFDAEGAFKWDDTGNIIIIDIIDAPTHYIVAENELIRLDDDGKPTGNFALKKVR